jgi:multidrug efflux pump subunit AcrB
MLASYLLSRTIVPTMAKYLLKAHDEQAEENKKKSRNPLVRLQLAFEYSFEKLRSGYHNLLKHTVAHPVLFTICFFAACLASFALFPWLGQDFFPTVDSGQFKLHVRAQTGTRIEETARLCDLVEDRIRKEIPKSEVTNILDNIGLPYSGINLSYSNSAAIGPADADIQVSLAEKHKPTDEYVHTLRAKLAQEFPGVTFYFLPADIVSQILNFGLPAPVDIQIVGQNIEGNREYADKLLNQIKYIPGTTDLRIQQAFNAPKLQVDIDRTKSQQAGYTARDVASNLLVALSGSFQTAPTFWLNPKNGVSYNIATQTPQYQTDTLQGLGNLPITSSAGTPPQILNSLASIRPGQESGTVSHYNVQPVLDIYGSVQGRDLGGVSKDINRILADTKKDLPRGTRVIVRGQVQTMNASFIGLLGGLFFSIVLVYLLIVVNFQSWMDPFIIIAALPAALAGIVWFLFLTHTTLSVPALTGSIMCMGVATANSILVVSFAKEQMQGAMSATEAALAAGFTRFRPVLMTALAMIIGMVPMALGLGEGGEQNAPLGRAVIGGLILATLSTLFFVPTFFSLVHAKDERKTVNLDD